MQKHFSQPIRARVSLPLVETALTSGVDCAYFRARGHIPSPLRHFCFSTIFLDLSLANTISVLESCVAKEYARHLIQSAWDEGVNCCFGIFFLKETPGQGCEVRPRSVIMLLKKLR